MIGEPRTPPTAGIFDAPGVSLCLNTEWASFVDGLLGQLLRRDRWEDGTESEIDFAIDQVNLLIAKLGDVGVCTLTPIGATMIWWTDTIPAGWLKMGQNVSKTTYPELFDIFGYTYGGGFDIFTLPTMTGYSPFGAGASVALGATAGADSHNLSVAELPAHNHGVNDPGHAHRIQKASATVNAGVNTSTPNARTDNPATPDMMTDSHTTGISIQNTGGGAAFSLLHPVRGANFIIFAGH